jgi:Asp-tRNA(Asn)/Glu-tRNA(Gln) amidotransferase A subunit family amidase
MAKTVADVDLLAATLDPTGFAAPPRPGRKIVGYDPGYFADAEQVVREDFESVLAACRDLGYTVTEVSLPKPDEVLPIHGKIFSIESYAFYNSTYPDAVAEYPTLAADMFAYAQSLGPETYVLAMRQRAALTQRVQAVLDEVDFVLTPTLPLLRPIKDAEGFMIGDQWVEFTFALVRYTCLFDHTGHPVLAMPMGIQGPGLATSVQVIGPLGGDQAVVQFGAELESALALNVDRAVSGLA